MTMTTVRCPLSPVQWLFGEMNQQLHVAMKAGRNLKTGDEMLMSKKVTKVDGSVNEKNGLHTR